MAEIKKKRGLRGYLLNTLISVLLTAILISVGFFWMHGIPLWGIPKAEQVSEVTILDTRFGEERTFTDANDIEKAVNLANFLNYDLGTAEQGEAVVTITYHRENGDEVVVSANQDTAYYNGKAYNIHDENGELFLNLTEGLFFLDLAVEAE